MWGCGRRACARERGHHRRGAGGRSRGRPRRSSERGVLRQPWRRRLRMYRLVERSRVAGARSRWLVVRRSRVCRGDLRLRRRVAGISPRERPAVDLRTHTR
jgi:hypothetical protein